MAEDYPPETLAALRAAVEKWRKNEACTLDDVKIGPSECPLCALFYGDDCFGCPVADASGCEYCEGTPFERIYDATDETWPDIARAEREFLESLLPKEETK